MTIDFAIRRAQVYGFLAGAFLYPAQENWTEDVSLITDILADLNFCQAKLSLKPVALPDLQATHRRTFGVTGSLGYETEYGLPHEYRQSQEMADLSGFYQAFGFTTGGAIRERADHVAMELEFMHVLALKEAYAIDRGVLEQVDVCVEAQGKFLQDHLGRWIDLYAQSLTHNTGEGIFSALAHFAADFITADANRLGVQLQPRQLNEVKHTPFDPDFSCATCLAAEMSE